MQGQDFKFFLIDDQGRSYFVENGIVKLSTSPKPLNYSPDGWQNIKVSWERNTTFFGVVRNYTLPFSFIEDGALILLTLESNKNFENKVFLYVTKNTLEIDITNSEYYFYYKYLYKGEIDLSTIVQSNIFDGGKVQVSIMEGGASKYLKSRATTTYEVDCNSNKLNNEIPVRLDGINFRSLLNFEVISTTASTFPHTIGLVFLNEDGESYNVFKDSQTDELIPNGVASGGTINSSALTYFASSTNYFFLSSIDLQSDLLITGTFTAELYDQSFGVPQNAYLVFVALYEDGSDFYQEVVATNLTLSSTTITINKTISKLNILKNRKCFLVLKGNVSVIATDSSIKLTLITKLNSSVIYAQRPDNLFNSLCKKASDNEYAGESSLLTSATNLAITSGNSIRGLSNATIKTNLQDFYNAINVQLNIGLSYSSEYGVKKFYINSKDNYFDISNVIALGEVKNFKRTIAKEYIANTLKIGYPNQNNITTTNGKEEFNNTHLYQLPVNRIVKELNLVSPYRADGYGIEQIRAQTLGTEKVSNPGDNDTFILEIEDTMTTIDGVAAYNVKRLPNTAIVTGLFAEKTAYNIGLSPKRILRKHSNYLWSILNGFDGEKIKYNTTEQNGLLKTVDGSVIFQENADITIGTSFYFNRSKLFLPYFFEFDAQVPSNLIELLETNQNSCFSFKYNGNIFYGFLIKATIDVSSNEDQQFTLLSAPVNNIKKLING